MPPTSNIRNKPSASTTTMTTTITQEPSLTTQRRTTSGRAVRANTTRPSNYYARPFASYASQPDPEIDAANPPGFFPALQFFSDAVAALPREVMRQFTLMKEVEAKIHGPNERMGEVLDALMEEAVPCRKSVVGDEGAGLVGGGGHGLLSLTANNSLAGSTSASLVNGVAPTAQMSVDGSVDGDEGGEEEVTARRKRRFQELRALTHDLLPNIDEKNVVLAEANRVLAQQLMRIDSVLPHIDNEISEDARLGSVTHWAYSDNRQKRSAGGALQNRRDVAATNSLAAAASAVHENDIAKARRDAVRDTAREKHKGKTRDQLDSDFDDKPKKTQAKIAKTKIAAMGLGANGEPVKKRKLKDAFVAPGMERTLSKGAKGLKETPRSTPSGETVKKTTKAKPAPTTTTKKKGPNSAQNSPALASSPLHSTFAATSLDSARPQSARLRQNSTATNLRHEKLAEDDDGHRAISAPSKANGEKKRKAPAAETDDSEHKPAVDAEDTEMPDADRSASNSGKAGRGSKTGTPRNENFPDAPAMVRARSTRSLRANRDDSSSEPQSKDGSKGGKLGKPAHKRVASNSHLVKQLAPFNRSPDIDRGEDEDDEEFASRQEEAREAAAEAAAEEMELSHAQEPAQEDMNEEETPPPTPRPRSRRPTATTAKALSPSPSPVPAAETDSDGDPDDPDEPKYCYCDRGSYGEMIACDNEACPREWFHLGCTGLREPPAEEEKWYCEGCKPFFVEEVKAKGVGRGRGRGRGR